MRQLLVGCFAGCLLVGCAPAVTATMRHSGFGPGEKLELKCVPVVQETGSYMDFASLEKALKPYYADGWRLAYSYMFTTSTRPALIGNYCLERPVK